MVMENSNLIFWGLGAFLLALAAVNANSKQSTSQEKPPTPASGGAEGNVPPFEVQPANKQSTSQEKPPASTSGVAEGNVPPFEVQLADDKPNNITDVAKEVEDGKQSDKVSDKPKDSDISDKKGGQQNHLHQHSKK